MKDQQWIEMMRFCIRQRAAKLPLPRRQGFIDIAETLFADEGKTKKEIRDALAGEYIERMR